jgi:lysophospholipase L1-like esterase
MKGQRKILLVFCLLLAVGLAAQSPQRRLHVVLLGDSNTWIGGDDCDQPRGWNKWFKDEFQPLSCRSYARSGATWTNTERTEYNTEENVEVLSDNNVIYNQINRLLKAVEEGQQTTPDVIVVMAGTNDMWFTGKRPGVFAMTAEEAFVDTAMLQRPANRVLSLAGSVRYGCDMLKSSFPHARLVLITPMQTTKVSVELAERTGNVIEACGKQLGVDVIRLDKEGCVSRAQELKRKTHTADGVHTNEAGARCVGKFVARRLKEVIQ